MFIGKQMKLMLLNNRVERLEHRDERNLTVLERFVVVAMAKLQFRLLPVCEDLTAGQVFNKCIHTHSVFK